MDDGASIFRKTMIGLIERLKNRYAYYQWQKTYHIKRHLQEIKTIYAGVDGFDLSHQEKKDHPNLSLTYGEIELESFLALLSLAKPKAHHIFYDLGSGLGKTVLAAAKTYGFQKSYGIETLKNLHLVAQSKYKQHAPELNIEFIQSDFHDIDWPDADILFINVASFISETWEALSQKLYQKPAPIIITCSKPLKLNIFTIQETKVLCSWGIVPAYIHHHKDNVGIFCSAT
jgi:hypothetical protein